jgi:hypothetical protein
MADFTLLTSAQEPIYMLIVSILFAAHLLIWPSYGNNRSKVAIPFLEQCTNRRYAHRVGFLSLLNYLCQKKRWRVVIYSTKLLYSMDKKSAKLCLPKK